MILAAFAFLSGVLALLVLPALPHLAIVIAAALVAVLAIRWRRYAASRALAWVCCGFLFAAAHAYHHLQHVWPDKTADERVRAAAVIESIPVARGDGWLFDARIRVAAPRPAGNTLRARLISRDPNVRPHAGERWQLLIALRPPRAALNPGAVDSERLLFHDRIHVMGTVVTSRLNQRLDAGHSPLTALRERIARHIERQVTDRDAAALIAALAVGATGAMSREQWRVFNATGTTHLVAISGLHVTLFALAMFAVARWLWSAFAWRWISWARDDFAAVLGLIAATGYATLAGMSVPTQRTLIMLTAWLLSRSMARASSPLQPLAIALIAVLLFDPFAPLAAGFWLSFAAMGAILFVIQTRLVRRGTLHEAIAVQLAVAAVLVPLTFASFGSISLLGPLVNAAAIPFVSWLMVPVILLALMLLPLWSAAANFALALAEWLHNLAWLSLVAVADSPLALIYASPPMWWYACAALGIGIALVPWPLRLRLAVVLCLLPLTAANHSSPELGAVELTALDVGEGTAMVVQTARHVLVYGTGEAYGTEGSRVESVLVPFLRSRSVRTVDELVIAKLTPMTGSGVTALFAAMPVRQTRIGGTAVPDFEGARACRAGHTWMWDRVRFQVGHNCALSIQPLHAKVELATDTVRLTDAAGTPWAIVSGRGKRAGKEQRLVAQLRQGGVHVLATGEVGAVRMASNPLSGMTTPEGLRSTRRTIWRWPLTPGRLPQVQRR